MQMLVQILGLWLSLLTWFDNDRLGKFTRIARINKTIERADEALAQKRYQAAIREYTRLENEFNHHSDYLSMNFGHACYLSGQTDKALEHYQKVANALDAKIASEAYRMMGKIIEQKGNFEQAEEAFKKALLKNPRNHTARQNLLDLRKRKPEPKPKEQQEKKEQEEKEKQASSNYGNKNEQPNSQQKNQNQQGDKSEEQADDKEAAKGKDQKGSGIQKAERDAKGGQKANTADGDEEGKEKEASENDKDKKYNSKPLTFNQAEGDYQVSKEELKKMNLSPEKAKAMLEAMRNAEIQYLQQKQVKSIFNNKGNKQNW